MKLGQGAIIVDIYLVQLGSPLMEVVDKHLPMGLNMGGGVPKPLLVLVIG